MNYLKSMKDYISNMGKQTYVREPEVDPYMKFSPELRKMVDAMAYNESINGKARINKGDQRDGTDSYGLLHMGQDAVDMWNKQSGEKLKAKDLMGPESDAKQKFIQASRIDRDMKVNKRDLFGATRYVQNYGDPDYATSTMNKYNQYINSLVTK